MRFQTSFRPGFRAFTFLLLFLTILVNCSPARQPEQTGNDPGIRDVLISAHRGGPAPGYPENALETLQHTVAEIPGVMVEVDVRATKDNRLVLLHDETLERTTTGTGKLDALTFDEVADYRLVDSKGTVTNFTIPHFRDVLEWASDADVYLSLDVKGRELFKPVIDLVNEYGMANRVEIITYSLQAAEQVHRIDEDIHISSSIRNQRELDEYRRSGLPPEKIAAFTGLSLRPERFYEALKKQGMVVTLGTIGNLDRQATARGDKKYREWQQRGIDRFATDRPFTVNDALD